MSELADEGRLHADRREDGWSTLRKRNRRQIASLRFLLTPTGGLFTGILILAACMGAVSRTLPIYHVLCGLGGIWGAVLLATWFFRPKVALSGLLPHHLTAGEELEVRLDARNRRALPCFDLSLRLDGGANQLTGQVDLACTHLSRGAAGSISIKLRALKRGVYGPLRYRAFSSFPSNFFRFGRGVLRQNSLLVYPAFSPLAAVDISMGRKFQPGGIALTSSTGESPEYIGNREYRAGDPIRRIDFKAWARIGRPAVREYQEEYFCRVALVLDTFVPSTRRAPVAGYPQMESAISLCAAVADCLARGEYIIDLFAAGPELYVFRAGRHTAHFENVMEILACLDPCQDDPFARLTPALSDELGNITTLIFVVLDWDEGRAGLARAAMERGCGVKVLLVREGPATIPLHDAECEIAVVTPAQVRDGMVDRL